MKIDLCINEFMHCRGGVNKKENEGKGKKKKNNKTE